jgi:uncharacterized membrane-anchored protein
MTNDNFNTEDNTQNNLITDFKVLEQKYIHEQEKNFQKEQDLIKAYDERNKLRADLEQTNERLNRLERELEVTKERLKNTETNLTQQNKEEIKKNRSTKLLAIIATVLFLMASLLFNYGNSLITSNPPQIVGILVLFIASLMGILAAIINILIIGGSN